VGAVDVGGRQPRTPIEEVLSDLFGEVLGLDRPPLHASFFELGGHSLQALRVIDGAHRRGLSLTPAHLFQHPSIAALAAVAGTRVVQDTDAPSLVQLSAGTGPAVFFLHSIPGDLLHYGHLVQRLGPDRPCYGFQALGLTDAARTHRTVEEMAAHYVSTMVAYQPEGPYHLAGWCFGGAVAAEMAVQLHERGREVGVLALMESVPAQAPSARRYLRQVGLFLRMGRDTVPYVRAKVRGRLAPRRDPRTVFALDVSHGPLAHRLTVHDANMAAIGRFRSRRYPGRLLLFKTARRGEAALYDPDYGWPAFAEHVDVHPVEGAHATLLKPPHVDAIADVLRAALG
jgi:thioesterase domain-containing protein